MGNVGICKLCEQEKELIGRSHIIPRGFYQDMDDEIDKYFQGVPSGEKAPRVYLTTQKSKQIQSGFHAPDILCSKCEQLLGKWDNYAQTLLLNKNSNIRQSPPGINLLIDNIDYKQLKLFFMSVLWRSSIVKNIVEFFKEVDIGVEWETTLRNMLLENNPGDEDDFSVWVFKYQGIEAYNMPSPIKKKEEVESYRFRMSNYGFLIKVDKQPFAEKIKQFILKPNNSFKLLIQDYKSTQEYLDVVNFTNDSKE